MLTNGRTFAWPDYSRRFAALEHPNISLAFRFIPILRRPRFVVQARARSIKRSLASIKRRETESAWK